jgi:hypothetical protein
VAVALLLTLRAFYTFDVDPTMPLQSVELKVELDLSREQIRISDKSVLKSLRVSGSKT